MKVTTDIFLMIQWYILNDKLDIVKGYTSYYF